MVPRRAGRLLVAIAAAMLLEVLIQYISMLSLAGTRHSHQYTQHVGDLKCDCMRLSGIFAPKPRPLNLVWILSLRCQNPTSDSTP